ncbi:hypothetical protein KKC59_02475, partial [bacterium]|nr:hypothetical protein [bacterium]
EYKGAVFIINKGEDVFFKKGCPSCFMRRFKNKFFLDVAGYYLMSPDFYKEPILNSETGEIEKVFLKPVPIIKTIEYYDSKVHLYYDIEGRLKVLIEEGDKRSCIDFSNKRIKLKEALEFFDCSKYYKDFIKGGDGLVKDIVFTPVGIDLPSFPDSKDGLKELDLFLEEFLSSNGSSSLKKTISGEVTETGCLPSDPSSEEDLNLDFYNAILPDILEKKKFFLEKLSRLKNPYVVLALYGISKKSQDKTIKNKALMLFELVSRRRSFLYEENFLKEHIEELDYSKTFFAGMILEFLITDTKLSKRSGISKQRLNLLKYNDGIGFLNFYRTKIFYEDCHENEAEKTDAFTAGIYAASRFDEQQLMEISNVVGEDDKTAGLKNFFMLLSDIAKKNGPGFGLDIKFTDTVEEVYAKLKNVEGFDRCRETFELAYCS